MSAFRWVFPSRSAFKILASSFFICFLFGGTGCRPEPPPMDTKSFYMAVHQLYKQNRLDVLVFKVDTDDRLPHVTPPDTHAAKAYLAAAWAADQLSWQLAAERLYQSAQPHLEALGDSIAWDARERMSEVILRAGKQEHDENRVQVAWDLINTFISLAIERGDAHNKARMQKCRDDMEAYAAKHKIRLRQTPEPVARSFTSRQHAIPFGGGILVGCLVGALLAALWYNTVGKPGPDDVRFVWIKRRWV